MATDLATRRPPSKSEAYLQSKFAELCARIKRVDLLTHLLVLSITIFTYAFFVGCFDWLAGSSTTATVQATRWAAYAGFLIGFGFLGVQTVRCCLRRVSPYYVAHQIERNVPAAKNSLINWLDLHEQGLPPAFQKNLSAVAAEQLEECDAERTVPRRRNRILLGVLGAPTFGLLILLLLGPSAFFSSMLRAFLPFYTPAPAPRTIVTLLTPNGDGEVGPAQSVTFSAKIDGRVPTGKAKPTLHYRWNADDDFLTLPLQSDGAGVWSAQLLPAQLRAGVTYKITAGDAETLEHQVRTRPAAHVQKFEIKYQHRPFRKHKDTSAVFPDDKGSMPIIHGPIGSEVDLTIHASRPVKSASIEITAKSGKKELPIRMLPDDPQAFACRFTLDQPGQFRVAFTTPDGEENADRDAYPILVAEDDLPKVILTLPGADLDVPENGTLTLVGNAVSPLGVKGLTLRLRIIDGPDKAIVLLPQPFRAGKSFQLADGSYPPEIAYLDFIAVDQLKSEKGTIRSPQPGNVIEYWLEATDAADYPNPAGNIGKSLPYKITLIPKVKDSASQEAIRDKAIKGRKEFQDRQDIGLASKNPDAKNGNNPGGPNPQKSLEQIQKENNAVDEKLKNAAKGAQQNQKRGDSKGADQKNAENKGGPQNPGDAPQPKPSPKSGESAGNKKDQGKGQGGGGESRDDGSQKKKDDSSKGDRKDGSKDASTPAKGDGRSGMGKQEPPGAARDGGMMGKNGPETPSAKDNPGQADAPMPTAKGSKADGNNKDTQPPGTAKGIKQNGPDLPNKDQQTAGNPTQPPDGQAKSGKMNDPGSGESKQGPTDQASPGQARGDDQKPAPDKPTPDDIARQVPNLPRDDKAGDDAGKALALIAKKTDDPGMRDLALEILAANGRDPKTGDKKKAPNPYGSKPGVSPGIGDDIKTAAANREFIARIGQMQLDNWKKRLTPDLLKKAGMTEADWQNYVKNQEAYDAQVRRLNAEAARNALKALGKAKSSGPVTRTIDGQPGNESLQGSNALPPLELIDAARSQALREAEREKKK